MDAGCQRKPVPKESAKYSRAPFFRYAWDSHSPLMKSRSLFPLVWDILLFKCLSCYFYSSISQRASGRQTWGFFTVQNVCVFLIRVQMAPKMLVFPAPGVNLNCEPTCGLRLGLEQPEMGAAGGRDSRAFLHQLQVPILLNKRSAVKGRTHN